MKKLWASTLCFFLLTALVQAGTVSASDKMIEVKITNLSAKVVLTPPIVAASKNKIDFFSLTEPASVALEMLAEGGNTDDLKMMFEDQDAVVEQADDPILPGKTLTLYVAGKSHSKISVASMVLPTNDAFVALNSEKVGNHRAKTYYLSAYDAGTEVNDENCLNIPGPHCNFLGEGFNSDRNPDDPDDQGFIYPHPGIHGENDISAMMFSWTDPVAMVEIRIVKR